MIGENVLVRVVWGPREESAREVADRWLTALRALAAIDAEQLGQFVRLRENEAGGLDRDPLDDPAVALSVISDGRSEPPDPGFSARGVNGRQVGVHAYAGSASAVTLNLAYVEFTPATEEEAQRWYDIAEPALLALVSAWEPDHGNVWTKTIRRAQGPAMRDPFAGYATYLCAGRLVDGVVGGTSTPDGGAVFTASSLEDIVALGARLRSAGAFAPVPKDRPCWSVE